MMNSIKEDKHIKRVDNQYRPVDDRVKDFEEIEQHLTPNQRQEQAQRCMDCGIPFCHWGCPTGNLIPEWQEKLRHGDWKSAYELLQRTINFPEFTGRLCPAFCEESCVVEINDPPVTIRANERAIIEHAFEAGYVQPKPPLFRTGKNVAMIGSGPAGLACADTLNKLGHTVTLYEAADAVGGYLRYGIPDFKLEKHIIDRRVDLLIQEGLQIETGICVGKDITADQLMKEFDAICLAIGARVPRDLPVPGRELDGIHFAVDYLSQQNRVVAGHQIESGDRITAANKDVIVVGGGDTGADCVGTAIRQGAKSVRQLEILPKPPANREPNNPWPLWPRVFRTASSHEEGCERYFSTTTTQFHGRNNQVEKLITAQVEWQPTANGGYQMVEVPDSEGEFPAQLVLLAMGFVHVQKEGLVADLGIELSPRGSIVVDDTMMTSEEKVFAAGDACRGPSLIVWGIQEGRLAADHINHYLCG
jgi:glutamate synthase (NADPH) small chain